jgi:hypothetical protein
MLKRILSFIGWSIASFFFVIALVGLTTQTTRIISILAMIWGLICLPPLYHHLTGRYGWKRNVVGRLVAFFIAPILIVPAISSSPQVQTPPPVSVKAVEAKPPTIESPKPSPVSTPAASKSEPVAESEPTAKEASTLVESDLSPKSRSIKTEALTASIIKLTFTIEADGLRDDGSKNYKPAIQAQVNVRDPNGDYFLVIKDANRAYHYYQVEQYFLGTYIDKVSLAILPDEDLDLAIHQTYEITLIKYWGNDLTNDKKALPRQSVVLEQRVIKGDPLVKY